MIITTRLQTKKQRASALEAERFYNNSYAYAVEMNSTYQNIKPPKNCFNHNYRTNCFVLRNI